MWPHLAKFRNFGKSLQVFGKFLTVYFLFCKMLSQLCQICDIIGLICIVANSQVIKNNLTIWSHWTPNEQTRKRIFSAKQKGNRRRRRYLLTLCLWQLLLRQRRQSWKQQKQQKQQPTRTMRVKWIGRLTAAWAKEHLQTDSNYCSASALASSSFD